MKATHWKAKARAEGRVCPECLRPISKEGWKDMHNRKGKLVRSCWSCRYAHWEIPLYEHCGNVFADNADRDALKYLY